MQHSKLLMFPESLLLMVC